MKVPYRVDDLTAEQALDEVLNDVWVLCVELTRLYAGPGTGPSSEFGKAVGGVVEELFPQWFPVDLAQVDGQVEENATVEPDGS